MELCEDAVQTALLRAMQSWSQSGLPDNQGAWLYRVALNEVLGALRREKRTDTSADSGEQVAAAEDAFYLELFTEGYSSAQPDGMIPSRAVRGSDPFVSALE